MSLIETVGELCKMIEEAAWIIFAQSQLLAQHGITTEDGELEKRTNAYIEQARVSV